jgi:hypothetical protein
MPAAPAPSSASNGDFCSLLCDRVAACGVATKEACLPVCGPQVAQLTPEQRSQAIGMIENVPCDQFNGFTNRAGQPDGDGDDERDTEENDEER